MHAIQHSVEPIKALGFDVWRAAVSIDGLVLVQSTHWSEAYAHRWVAVQLARLDGGV